MFLKCHKSSIKHASLFTPSLKEQKLETVPITIKPPWFVGNIEIGNLTPLISGKKHNTCNNLVTAYDVLLQILPVEGLLRTFVAHCSRKYESAIKEAND